MEHFTIKDGSRLLIFWNHLLFEGTVLLLGYGIPIVFISSHSTVPLSVKAMKKGAVNFLCKPFDDRELLEAVKEALLQASKTEALIFIRQQLDSLTTREYEVMKHLISLRLFKYNQILDLAI